MSCLWDVNVVFVCLLNMVGIMIVLNDFCNECFIIFMVWIMWLRFFNVKYLVCVGIIILWYVVSVLIINILSIGG